jgi:hypothetical protein
MDTEANKRSAKRDRLAAELEGGREMMTIDNEGGNDKGGEEQIEGTMTKAIGDGGSNDKGGGGAHNHAGSCWH